MALAAYNYHDLGVDLLPHFHQNTSLIILLDKAPENSTQVAWIFFQSAFGYGKLPPIPFIPKINDSNRSLQKEGAADKVQAVST